MQFGVIGAGIVGLNTALQLQEEFPNAQVTIIADRYEENTSSYVAAGIFRPGNGFLGPTEEITRKWVTDAYNYWDNIRKSSEAPLAGVTQLSGYIFSTQSAATTRNGLLEELLPVYRRATEEELDLCLGGWKYGSFFTTCLTESKIYLPYATNKFKAAGGKFMKKKVESLTKTEDKYDVLVNCSGLGARDLCKDEKVVPIRGQVLKVRAPWIKMAFYGDFDTYIIPGFEGVTLGGCRQFDSWNTSVCKYDGMAIRERCYEMLPSLRKAEILREAVGLRPYRSSVRVKPEFLEDAGGRMVKVVHNYGHGGYGVTTAPGTSKYAVQLVRQVLSSNSKL